MEYVVHKEGQPGTIILQASGRIKTEPFEVPEWAGSGLAMAQLAARNQFYLTRLGTELAGPLLGSNIIAYDDLDWVCVDEAGDEFILEASDEYRQTVLATALGVDRDEGTIANAITDHYIDRQGDTYTAEQIAGKAEADALFKKQQAQG